MEFFLAAKYNSLVKTTMDGIYGLELFTDGVSQLNYMTSAYTSQSDHCIVSWADPTADMMATARELAFRVALRSANPANVTNMQPFVGGTQQQNVLIYGSNFMDLGIALLFTLLGVVCVLPTFFGWWKLGRKVSMSPLEIAKAFDAARLEDVDSNAETRRLLKEAGTRSVRYGAVSSTLPAEMDRLMMDEPNEVNVPSSGAVFR